MSQDDREAHGIVIDQRALDQLLGREASRKAPEPADSGPQVVPLDPVRPDVDRVSAEEAKPAAVPESPPPTPTAKVIRPEPSNRRPVPVEAKPVPRPVPSAPRGTPRPAARPSGGSPSAKAVRGTWANHFNQGLRLENQGQYEEAVREFQVATRQNPGDWRAHFAIGACSLRLGDPAAAVAALKTASRLKPGEKRISLLLATALHASGAFEEARHGYEALVEDMPESEELLTNLTLVCAVLEDADAVSLWAGRLQGLMPGSIQAGEALAAAALVQGDYEAAAEHLDWLSKSENPSYEDWYNLGVCFHLLGRTDEAKRAYSQALGIRPNAVEAHANLGVLLHETNDMRGAREAYLRALRRSPDHAGILGNMTVLAEAMGDAGEAEHWSSRLARIS